MVKEVVTLPLDFHSAAPTPLSYVAVCGLCLSCLLVCSRAESTPPSRCVQYLGRTRHSKNTCRENYWRKLFSKHFRITYLPWKYIIMWNVVTTHPFSQSISTGLLLTVRLIIPIKPQSPWRQKYIFSARMYLPNHLTKGYEFIDSISTWWGKKGQSTNLFICEYLSQKYFVFHISYGGYQLNTLSTSQFPFLN